MKIDHDKFLTACGNLNDHQWQGMGGGIDEQDRHIRT